MLHCIVIGENLGTQWPAGLWTACNTRFTWICCPPPLYICCVYVLHLSASVPLYFYHHLFSRICSRIHCGFVAFVSRICHHHLTGFALSIICISSISLSGFIYNATAALSLSFIGIIGFVPSYNSFLSILSANDTLHSVMTGYEMHPI